MRRSWRARSFDWAGQAQGRASLQLGASLGASLGTPMPIRTVVSYSHMCKMDRGGPGCSRFVSGLLLVPAGIGERCKHTALVPIPSHL